jgi:hypothetical protein
MKTLQGFGVFVLAAIALLTSPVVDAQERWGWVVTPYLWAIDVKADLEAPILGPGGVTRRTSFNDVIDNFDGAFQMHAEGQGDRFGVFADFSYLGLSNDATRPLFHADVELDTRLIEVAGVWHFGGGSTGADVFGGLRYIDVDIGSVISPAPPLGVPPIRLDGGETFSDFMLGARYTWTLSDRWGLTVRGDGSWGDTEGTWNASIIANYKMRSGEWSFGYRYLDVDAASGDISTHLVIHGPEIGYGFKF